VALAVGRDRWRRPTQAEVGSPLIELGPGSMGGVGAQVCSGPHRIPECGWDSPRCMRRLWLMCLLGCKFSRLERTAAW
jgi:hypothetical protein